MLYQFQFEIADIDRGFYERINFRIVQNPSEVPASLLCRALAFALNFQEGLEFSPNGLSDPDTPAIQLKNPQGGIEMWIEIGSPSVRKLHKAGKLAKKVVIYTYKSAPQLLKEISNNEVHRAKDINIFWFNADFLETLELELKKNNRWSLLHQHGQLDVNTGNQNVMTEIHRSSLQN